MWINLENQNQLDQLIEDSKQKKVAIFKHSTSCGISSMVKRNFESDMSKENDSEIDVYYLDLIQFRSISNQIASQFNITHESPQLIVIKDGQAIHDASHSSISFANI